MAQLKDLIVNGNTRLVGNVIANNTIQGNISGRAAIAGKVEHSFTVNGESFTGAEDKTITVPNINSVIVDPNKVENNAVLTGTGELNANKTELTLHIDIPKGNTGRGISKISSTNNNGSQEANTVTVTYDDGASNSFNVYNGKDGYTPKKNTDYFDGKDGRGISKISSTNNKGSHATNTVTVTYDDNTSNSFNVYNGTDGAPGKNGDPGKDGTTVCYSERLSYEKTNATIASFKIENYTKNTHFVCVYKNGFLLSRGPDITPSSPQKLSDEFQLKVNTEKGVPGTAFITGTCITPNAPEDDKYTIILDYLKEVPTSNVKNYVTKENIAAEFNEAIINSITISANPTTLESNQSATAKVVVVSDSPEKKSYRIDLGIPKGIQGKTGPRGETGPQGPRGDSIACSQTTAKRFLIGSNDQTNIRNGLGTYSSCYMENGNIYATSFNVTSARKFKENIHPTNYTGLDIINNAEVVDYNYIEDINKDPKIGLIADDCPAILAAPNRQSLDVNNCIGILMKAVQELSKQNQELKDKINQLEIEFLKNNK